MGSYTTRDLIWDISIKHIVSGDPFTATDIVDAAGVPISPQDVTHVLESVACLGWVEEQTDLDESEWHPCVDLKADELPSLDTDSEGAETDTKTKYDTSNSQSSSGETTEGTDDSEPDDAPVGEEETEINSGSEGGEPDARTVEGIGQASELIEGEVYVGTVDRLTPNAIIELEGGHVNLGPISKDAEGEEVRFKPFGGLWGECLDEEYTYEGYSPKDNVSKSSSSRSWKSSSSNSRVTSSRVPNKGGTTGGAIGGKDPDNKNKLLNGLR